MRVLYSNYEYEMKVIFILFVIHCNLLVIYCSLISQSILDHCSGGDSSEPVAKNGQPCRKKFVVSMTLRSSQEGTEAIYGTINTAYDVEKKQKGILKTPFRIEIDKSEVIVNYRVYYRGSANAIPSEHIIASSTSDCIDDWYSEDVTCSKYVNKTGHKVWDSQGFCCKCEFSKNNITRGNATCEEVVLYGSIIGEDEVRYDYRSSAHCMNFSDLWYDVFEVESPSLHYNISVQLKVLEVTKQKDILVQKWRNVSKFSLNPAQPSGRSPSGRIVAGIEGDLLGSRGLMDLSTKRLLIPSLRAWHKETHPPEYTNGPSDWLLVDEHLVDLSGTECNKVGVSFTGFRNQNGKCYQLPESCFSNQPSLFWKADNERRKHGIQGFYMMHNYGEIHKSTHINNNSFIMRMIYSNFHNTFVTFRLDASDVSFVVNVGKARIVKAESRGFNKSTSTAGEVLVIVQNQGDLTQEFVIALTKCFGREDLPTRRVTVKPGHSEVVIFPLLARNKGKITAHCEVQLFDQRFALLGSAKLTFSIDAPCFCFGVCGCTCDEFTGEVTNKECPTPPPIYVDKTRIGIKLFLHVLELIGLHGFVGFFCGTLLCCGCVRLLFGGVIFCRKSKAQEYHDEMRRKGAHRGKGPMLVKCSGECRGAKAAKARVKRKVKRYKKMGKDPHRLDNWANTSFVCSCNDEISDIRFMNVIRALCFFYYLLILPFILLGKTIYWKLFVHTADKKKAAESAVLKAATKKGTEELEKLGVVSIHKQLVQQEKKFEKMEKMMQDVVNKKVEEEVKGEEKAQVERKKLQKKEMKALGMVEADIRTAPPPPPLLPLSPPPLSSQSPSPSPLSLIPPLPPTSPLSEPSLFHTPPPPSPPPPDYARLKSTDKKKQKRIPDEAEKKTKSPKDRHFPTASDQTKHKISRQLPQDYEELIHSYPYSSRPEPTALDMDHVLETENIPAVTQGGQKKPSDSKPLSDALAQRTAQRKSSTQPKRIITPPPLQPKPPSIQNELAQSLSQQGSHAEPKQQKRIIPPPPPPQPRPLSMRDELAQHLVQQGSQWHSHAEPKLKRTRTLPPPQPKPPSMEDELTQHRHDTFVQSKKPKRPQPKPQSVEDDILSKQQHPSAHQQHPLQQMVQPPPSAKQQMLLENVEDDLPESVDEEYDGGGGMDHGRGVHKWQRDSLMSQAGQGADQLAQSKKPKRPLPTQPKLRHNQREQKWSVEQHPLAHHQQPLQQVIQPPPSAEQMVGHQMLLENVEDDLPESVNEEWQDDGNGGMDHGQLDSLTSWHSLASQVGQGEGHYSSTHPQNYDQIYSGLSDLRSRDAEYGNQQQMPGAVYRQRDSNASHIRYGARDSASAHPKDYGEVYSEMYGEHLGSLDSAYMDMDGRVQEAVDERLPGVVYGEPLHTLGYSNEEPIYDKVSPEPIYDEVSSEPIYDEVSPEPIYDEVSPEPIYDEVSPEPISDEISPEPIYDEIPTPLAEPSDGKSNKRKNK